MTLLFWPLPRETARQSPRAPERESRRNVTKPRRYLPENRTPIPRAVQHPLQCHGPRVAAKLFQKMQFLRKKIKVHYRIDT